MSQNSKFDAFDVEENESKGELVKLENADGSHELVTHQEVRDNFLIAQQHLTDGMGEMLSTLQKAGETYAAVPIESKILDGMAKIMKSMTDGAKTIANLHNIVKTEPKGKGKQPVDNGSTTPSQHTAEAVLVGGAAMANIIKGHREKNPATISFDDEEEVEVIDVE